MYSVITQRTTRVYKRKHKRSPALEAPCSARKALSFSDSEHTGPQAKLQPVQAAEPVAHPLRAEQAALEWAVIFISLIFATHPTMGELLPPKISWVASRLTEMERSLANSSLVAHIVLLLMRACMLPTRILAPFLSSQLRLTRVCDPSLGLSDFLRTKLIEKLKEEEESVS
jgi:hypothetical protein